MAGHEETPPKPQGKLPYLFESLHFAYSWLAALTKALFGVRTLSIST